MKIRLAFCLLLCGCGELIPCKTDDLGTREIHSGTLRTDGIYVSNRGGLACSGDTSSGLGSVNLYYSNGFSYIGGCVHDSQRRELSSTIPKNSILESLRPGLGIFWQRGTELLIHSWAPTTRPCNKMVTQKGIIVNDSTFQIYSWKLNGEEHNVSWTFRLYSGIIKPDSTNKFIP